MENKVVIDTNVWISFLIGKHLQKLKSRLSDSSVKIIISEQLIRELNFVTSRPKFKKYFNKQDVADFIKLISLISLPFQINEIERICRDPKDDFLLSLCLISKADYLITGDKDLLEIKEYLGTKIISMAEFEDIL